MGKERVAKESTESKPPDPTPPPTAKDMKPKAEELKEEMDALIDDIDKVLEDATIATTYRQLGGQ